MKYDLKWLDTFIHVAQLKSFSRAGEVLNISKSHVTTIIGQLEKAAGMALLARTTREVNLTSDGREFLNYCQSVMEKVDQLDEFIDNHNEIAGQLRIVIPPYFSRYHIVPYLEEFLSLYPKLKLQISLTENPVNIIEDGHDLQIRIQIPSEENLEVFNLMSNQKVICASPRYLEKYGTPTLPEDLLSHNCIVFGENKIWELQQKQTKEVVKLTSVAGNIKCDNGEIIKELVLAGIGITLKSSRDIQDELRAGSLIELLTEYEVVHQTKFYAVYPSNKINSPKIKAFLEFFAKKLN